MNIQLGEPFLIPGKPLILRKKLKNDCLDYFYFCAHREINKNIFYDCIDMYTIIFKHLNIDKFQILELNNIHKSISPYDGYCIVIEKDKSASIYNHDYKSLDFIINPPSLGIGSIILNHLCDWGKKNYPEVKSPRIKLSPVDEINPQNKERRNRLYDNVGLMEKKNKTLNDLTPKIDKRGFEIILVENFIEYHLYKDYFINRENNYIKKKLIHVMNEEVESKFYKPFIHELLLSMIMPLILVGGYIIHKFENSLDFIIKFFSLYSKIKFNTVDSSFNGINNFPNPLTQNHRLSPEFQNPFKYCNLPDSHLLGCILNNTLIGILGYDLQDNNVIISYIFVLYNYRKKGLGRLLIKNIILDPSVEYIIAEVYREDIKFYQKCGFKIKLIESSSFEDPKYECKLHIKSKKSI